MYKYVYMCQYTPKHVELDLKSLREKLSFVVLKYLTPIAIRYQN